MLMQNQRPLFHTATPTNSAFAMCPAVLREAWTQPTPTAAPAMYAYAFEQAQRIVAAEQLRRRFEAFHLN